MRQETIRKRFEEFLRERGLKLTAQRERIFERAFATHDHFSAEILYGWLSGEEGPKVSRATVYRTLNLLSDGGFIESLDPGSGELVYEHVLGHQHHDHLICTECGRIEEFREQRIEELQEAVAERLGYELVSHSLRLMGTCPACRAQRPRAAEQDGGAASASGA